ncbi:unnamed protein product [Lactuca saligna]|uniref:Uncharacterized protein n=1 Tax=Lactuca saligna TaxID=75948 RepID=A0AA35ZAI9_LACSI|nr:unnamed protein product [Lactuca saligna]
MKLHLYLCVFLGHNLLSWSLKRQTTISRSSAKVEYRGVANAIFETTWLRNLLWVLHFPPQSAIFVYCNNESAVYLSTNPVQHQRTKHIEIEIYFVPDKVALGHVRVLHVPSSSQYTDIFTKGLPFSLFLDFRSSLDVCSRSPDWTAGGCEPISPLFKVNCQKPETNSKFWMYKIWEFAKEDTNRVTFSLKVGLAVLLVSLLILLQAPYQVFSTSIIWSILTVAIMFEYTVGATFHKGFNRVLGSLFAGVLAIAVAELALMSGPVAEPIIIGHQYIHHR